jgi:hypothetical protein
MAFGVWRACSTLADRDSVGDVAATGPSGVNSAPRTVSPHSGGVRIHRRYVFAPGLPRFVPRLITPGRRGGWKVGLQWFHRVGGRFAGPESPPTSDSFLRTQREDALPLRASRLPESMDKRPVGLE